MSVEISADTAVVMKVKGQYLAVSKTAKRFPRSQTRSPGFVLSQLAVLRTTRVICDLCGQERQQD